MSDAQVYAQGIWRQFEIVLPTAVTGIGLTTQGWNSPGATVEAFSSSGASLGIFTFGALGLVTNDKASDGFSD